MALNKFPQVGTYFTQTGSAITDNSSGTASSTIAAIGATYNQDEVRNAVASLAAEVENNRADIATLIAALNAAN
jgi:ribonuclease HI